MATLQSTLLGQIYLGCLLFGAGFFLIGFVVGGHHFHHGFGHHLNIRNVLAFLAAFGAIGVISTFSALTVILGLLLSIVAGVGMAAFAGWFFTRMIDQQGTSQPDDSDLEGRNAVVTLGIPADGRVGEIRAIVKNQYVTLRAKPHVPGESFERGAAVVTVDYQQGVATVIKAVS